MTAGSLPAAFGAFAALAALAALALPGCNRGGESQVSVQEAILQREQLGLRALIAAAHEGPLIPFQQVLVVLDQRLIQDLLEAATPYERMVADRYRVRVTAASVRFEDGFALVRLDGRASFANREESDVAADVEVFGGLDIVDLDRASGVLRGRVRIIGVQAKRITVMGRDTGPVRKLVEDLGRSKVEEFNVLGSTLEIPVQLEQEVVIPEVGPEGDIHIPAATVPLRVAVQDVKAFRGKLWVSIGVAVVVPGQEDAPPPEAAPGAGLVGRPKGAADSAAATEEAEPRAGSEAAAAAGAGRRPRLPPEARASQAGRGAQEAR
ncbi:MAG: hypothetical protein H0V09_00475 [Gemmatimonadetes bacterium]|nr:hypothetical protein [Gemmatimonadota bacterium]